MRSLGVGRDRNLRAISESAAAIDAAALELYANAPPFADNRGRSKEVGNRFGPPREGIRSPLWN